MLGSTARTLQSRAALSQASAEKPALSVVVPCYNEEEVVDEFVRRMVGACAQATAQPFEIILVNDGSSDQTWSKINEVVAAYPSVIGVDLLRNHGHQLAATAGLGLARGDRILLIDADLQEHPELLPKMMAEMDKGFDVVYGRRLARKGETAFKTWSASVFYRVLRSLSDVDIPLDTGDFRLMTRQVNDALNAMPERQRFIRGMVAWIGGRQTEIPYVRDERFAGVTKYTMVKMIRFALDAITSFSTRPLRLAVYMSFVAIFGAMTYLLYVLFIALSGATIPGWASLSVIVLLFSGIQLFALGVLGEYVGRAYMEIKFRPMYIIRDVVRSDRGEPEQ